MDNYSFFSQKFAKTKNPKNTSLKGFNKELFY